jgi:hypothetical protein
LSLMDDLSKLEQRVAKRMSELAPLVAEYEELQGMASKLGVKPQATSSSAPARRRRRRTSTATATRATSAARTAGKSRSTKSAGGARKSSGASRAKSAGGTRRDQVLEAVRTKPGQTVAQVAKQIGVGDPTSLYRIVRTLESERKIKKSGPKLQPVGK